MGDFFAFFLRGGGDGLLVTVWAKNFTRTKQTTYIYEFIISPYKAENLNVLRLVPSLAVSCRLLAKYMVGSMIKLLIIDFQTIIMYVGYSFLQIQGVKKMDLVFL